MNISSTIPVQHVLRTAKWIGTLAYTIALIGVIGSYGTQVVLLLAHRVGMFSYAIPATIDLLAICAAMALQLPGLDRGSRRIAGVVLTIAMAVSMTANVIEGNDLVARLAHAWPVLAYLLGELLANRVRAYAARLAAAQISTEPAISVAELESPNLPEAPVSPAVEMAAPKAPAAAKARGDYGPRGEQYSERHDRRKRTGK
jgi:hypothetical protein